MEGMEKIGITWKQHDL